MEILSTHSTDAVILLAAIILDRLIGDPAWLPHPIRWIGLLIGLLERRLLKKKACGRSKRIAGALTVGLTVGTVYAASSALLYFSALYSPLLFAVISLFIIWASISIKSLGAEARAVLSALETAGLEAARTRLSRIVGRDTAKLGAEEVIRATSETVAENTSDGIIAPLFYLAIGGPALMLSYKAVNTLDSMIGYRDERYADFGLVAAKTDDAANYLPARLTALLMVVTSFILRYDFSGAIKTIRRDGRKHPSPNAGVVEAAMAGALNIRFGGPASYRGITKDKPFIGSGERTADRDTLLSSIRIMEGTALIMLFALLLLAYF